MVVQLATTRSPEDQSQNIKIDEADIAIVFSIVLYVIFFATQPSLIMNSSFALGVTCVSLFSIVLAEASEDNPTITLSSVITEDVILASGI